ncbi:MAG: glycoside hydrolase [Treponema sp.]|jgi:spore germination protein YaaH|nr:glycoside hydrolase [Treponema sp.]
MRVRVIVEYVMLIVFALGIAMLCFTSVNADASEEMRAPVLPETDIVFLNASDVIEDVSEGTPDDVEPLPISAFPEIWGYVISGQEDRYRADMPISDIGFFGAEANIYGELISVPDPRVLRNRGFTGRLHLVAVCSGQALSHAVLSPGPVRQKFTADLLAAARAFDGLQIDFENVPARDGPNFRSFLEDLRSGLGNKLFTIAIRALVRNSDPVYDYNRIKGMMDRMLVMAYDEHWSNSAPGPIASMAWCRSVATYALQNIGPEKLVMGLPFYGRTWGDITTNSAYIHSSIERIKAEQGITAVQWDHDIPHFSYQTTVTINAYYEDERSIARRLDMYHSMGVRAVGFWRVGQESPLVWNQMKLEN